MSENDENLSIKANKKSPGDPTNVISIHAALADKTQTRPRSRKSSQKRGSSPSPFSRADLTSPDILPVAGEGSGILDIRAAPDPSRIAMGLYILRFRPNAASPDNAIRALYEALATDRASLPEHAPVADLETLRDWARMGDWEARYKRIRTEQVLASDPDLQPLARLNDLRRSLRLARASMDKAQEILTAAGATAKGPSSADYLNHRTAWTVYRDALDAVTQAETVVQRQNLENPISSDYWREMTNTTFTRLVEQYRGMGMHYEMLCRRLAEHDTRMQQITASGRDVTSDEYVKLQSSMLSLVNQLQKYTEATKSEAVTREVQNAMLAVMRVVADVVEPAYPVLWKQITNEVKKRVERGISAVS